MVVGIRAAVAVRCDVLVNRMIKNVIAVQNCQTFVMHTVLEIDNIRYMRIVLYRSSTPSSAGFLRGISRRNIMYIPHNIRNNIITIITSRVGKSIAVVDNIIRVTNRVGHHVTRIADDRFMYIGKPIFCTLEQYLIIYNNIYVHAHNIYILVYLYVLYYVRIIMQYRI